MGVAHRALWLVTGLLAGLSLATPLVLIAAGSGVARLLFDYQTLLGALIAVLTAAWAIRETARAAKTQAVAALRAAETQIAHDRALREQEQQEKLRVSRVMLVFTLSELEEHCRMLAGEMRWLPGYIAAPFPDDDPKVFKFILSDRKLPPAAREGVGRVAEFSPSGDAEQLADLLVQLQIFSTRRAEYCLALAQGMARDLAITRTFHHRDEIVALNARIQRVFPYARLEQDHLPRGPITAEEHATSAVSLGLPMMEPEPASPAVTLAEAGAPPAPPEAGSRPSPG